jgi:hypothetical protein
MFIVDPTALARNAALLHLQGKPTDSIAERVAAEKVVDLAAARARLRPPEPGSLASSLKIIAEAFPPG